MWGRRLSEWVKVCFSSVDVYTGWDRRGLVDEKKREIPSFSLHKGSSLEKREFLSLRRK